MQAQPQFTPGQILEAGQRAAAEGRSEYARQFFQHLIDHYRDTSEAATARNEMLNLAARPATATPPLAANAPDLRVAHPNGHPPGPGPVGPGRPIEHPPADPPPHPAHQRRHEPAFDRPHARHDSPPPMRRGRFQPEPHHAGAALPPTRTLAPALEKNYIAGRAFSGLLGFVGLAGLPLGIVMLYGAFADPALFAVIAVTSFTDALAVAGAVVLGSIALILVAQMARALFDAADAMGDLARLERHRLGLDDDE